MRQMVHRRGGWVGGYGQYQQNRAVALNCFHKEVMYEASAHISRHPGNAIHPVPVEEEIQRAVTTLPPPVPEERDELRALCAIGSTQASITPAVAVVVLALWLLWEKAVLEHGPTRPGQDLTQAHSLLWFRPVSGTLTSPSDVSKQFPHLSQATRRGQTSDTSRQCDHQVILSHLIFTSDQSKFPVRLTFIQRLDVCFLPEMFNQYPLYLLPTRG